MRRPRFGLVLATMIAVAGMPATAWAQGGGNGDGSSNDGLLIGAIVVGVALLGGVVALVMVNSSRVRHPPPTEADEPEPETKPES
jgi:hypothetical protein